MPQAKPIFIGIIILVIVVAAAILVIPNLDPAKAVFQDGKTLAEKGDYAGAIEKYQTLYTKYPDSQYAKQWRKEGFLAECYFNWAITLKNEGKFREAIEKYNLFFSDFNQAYATSHLDEAEDGKDQCYYSWGQELQNQGDYSQAIEMYRSTHYSSYEPSLEAIGECYIQWVSALAKAQDYDEAIQKYLSSLEEYRPPNWTQQEIADAIGIIPASVLYTWAETFQQQQSYSNALRLYETILQCHPQSEYVTQAQKAKIDTEIAQIAAGSHGFLPSVLPDTAQQLGGNAEYTIINDTSDNLTLLLSGPTTTSVTVSPKATQKLTLQPGTYKVAAKVDSPNVIPYYGESTFQHDMVYQSRFYIETR